MPSTVKDQRIHVLFLLISQNIGGAETHTVSLANGLDRDLFRVSLVYLKDLSTTGDVLGGVHDDVTQFCANVNSRIDLRAAANLARYTDEEAVDIVVCANPFPLLYALALRLFSRRRLGVVEIFHSTDHRRARMQTLALRPLFWMSDLLIYVCENQRSYWEKNLFWPRNSQVVHNGVDLSRFCNDFSPEEIREFRARYGFRADDYIVGVCGKMRPEKSHNDLVRAIGLARTKGIDVKCIAIGDGPMRGLVEASIDALGLGKHVAITGLIGDVRLAISSCDVIAVPSHKETFPIVALESMALRKPVIMSDVGGAAEAVHHAANGYLYPKGDVQSLAELICFLSDPERRAVLGECACSVVSRKFSSKKMMKSYTDILLSVMTRVRNQPNVYLSFRQGRR